MEIPVVIAAKNEEATIGRTLEKLSRQHLRVTPIVVINGATDQTPDIARTYGATVLESEPGKMRALQVGIAHLGMKALETLAVIDADTEPMTARWSRRLYGQRTNLPKEKAAVAWGPYVFAHDINPVFGAFFTATSMQVTWADRHKPHPRTIRGGNMALRLSDADVLENLLELPSYWPREDVAIYDTVFMAEGNKADDMHPDAWAITSGSRLVDALKKS